MERLVQRALTWYIIYRTYKLWRWYRTAPKSVVFDHVLKEYYVKPWMEAMNTPVLLKLADDTISHTHNERESSD